MLKVKIREMIKVIHKIGILLEKKIYILSYLLVGFTLTYIQEFIFRGSFLETAAWIRNNYVVFALNAMLITGVYIILTMAFNKLNLAAFVEGVFIILISSINYYKTLLKGDPLLFSDLMIAKESVEILKQFEISITWQITISIILLTFIIIILKDIKFPSIKLKNRLIIVILILGCMTIEFSYLRSNLVGLKVQATTFHIKESYHEKGLLFGMIREINPIIKKPSEYNEEKILQLMSESSIKDTQNKNRMPNIIIIMNETFYDIQTFKDINVSEDIMPNMRRYQKEFSSANCLTPVYGGQTCQVEYEVLTGYSLTNTGNRMGYTQLINKNIDSIVSVLNKKGYLTTALHPFSRTFFKRDLVYKWMGFKDMTFADQMENAVYEGNYIGDKFVYDTLISKYEAKENEPFFAHVVTMQNHGPYSYNYNKHNIRVLDSGLSNEAKQEIETYLNIVKEADESLGYLIEYFEKVKEPTIILFFGDHAPGTLGDAYSELGLNSEYQEAQTIIDEYTTPVLIWDNMKLEKRNYGYVNAYKLGALVLKKADINDDLYFNFLMQDAIPMGSNNFYWQDGTWIKKDELSEEQMKKLNETWLFQYDRMFGKRISLLGGR